MDRNNARIFLCVAVLTAFFGFDSRYALSNGSILTHLTFHFVHANIFHLLCNMYCVWLYLTSGSGRWWWWPTAYILATAVSFAGFGSIPVGGLSAVTCVYTGMVLSQRSSNVHRSLLMTTAVLCAGFLFGSRIAAGLHVVAFAAGFTAGRVMNTTHDLRRVAEL